MFLELPLINILSTQNISFLQIGSEVNTFLLNDLFTTHQLDFMIPMETWLHLDELSHFLELLRPVSNVFSSPRLLREGGLVSVKSAIHLELCEVNFPGTFLCTIKFNKNFNQNFGAFVSNILQKYNNIHLFPETKPLIINFPDLMDSFTGQIHERKHYLPLVSFDLCSDH